MKTKKILIKGVTVEGNKFRPSDWIDRLCSVVASFDEDHRMQYCDYLYPVMVDNERCLLLDETLCQNFPEIHQHVLNFIEFNELRVEHINEKIEN